MAQSVFENFVPLKVKFNIAKVRNMSPQEECWLSCSEFMRYASNPTDSTIWNCQIIRSKEEKLNVIFFVVVLKFKFIQKLRFPSSTSVLVFWPKMTKVKSDLF